MKAYDAGAVIQASPAAIWAILTDAPAYPAWDSGVERVEGRIAPRRSGWSPRPTPAGRSRSG